MKIEQAIKEMQHWIDYEKQNKDKINRADELIQIQETILQHVNKHLRYINFITLKIFSFEISIKIGNPMYFIQEFKNMKGGKKHAKSCKKHS